MKQKIVLEFDNFAQAAEWAAELMANPEQVAANIVSTLSNKTTTAPAKQKEDKKDDVEKPAASAGENGGVSKLLVDLKEAGIQLADFKPSRYAGVETALAWFGVSKIKDLKEEDQPKVLKMFNKMLKADKAGYEELLESLKQ